MGHPASRGTHKNTGEGDVGESRLSKICIWSVTLAILALAIAAMASYGVVRATSKPWTGIVGLPVLWAGMEAVSWMAVCLLERRRAWKIAVSSVRDSGKRSPWPVEPHPFLHFVPVPSLAVDGINREGFRSTGPPHGFEGIRLYIAGDCTAFDGQLPAADSLGYLLEVTLRGEYGADVEVINAGCQHYTSLHSFLRFAIDAQRYRLDVALLVTGINDVLAVVHTGGRPAADYEGFFRMPSYSPQLVRTLAERHAWLLHGLPSLRLGGVLALVPFVREPWDRKFILLNKDYRSPENIERCYELFHTGYLEANVRAFIAVCQVYGIQPVLMTNYYNREDMVQPVRAFYAYGIDQVNESMRHIARNEGALLIDMARAFRGGRGTVKNKWHYTREGNVERVHLIADSLGHAGLLSRPSRPGGQRTGWTATL